MRKTTVAVATAALALLLPAAPAGAGFNHSITASPTTLRPNESTTVTGTSDCNSSPYVVTISYTNPAGDPATATASGTTDASGEYTQPITLPETAVAGEPATVSSNITSCNGGGAAPSNTVNLTVNAYEGTLAVDPDEGETGTEVTITGTNCYGDDIVIAFGDGDEFPYEVEPVTLNEDRTFSATFTIPDEAGPGEYAFAAECPGSDFELAPFTVVAGEEAENEEPAEEAPVATPVGSVPTFTG